MKNVRDIMSRYVETVAADASVVEAAGRMRAFDLGSLPVTEGARMVGIVTDRDIALRVTALGWCGRYVHVKEVMTQDAVSCGPESTVTEAAWLMQNKHVLRLPVLDASSSLAGILTLGDLARNGYEELAGRIMAEMVQLIPVMPDSSPER